MMTQSLFQRLVGETTFLNIEFWRITSRQEVAYIVHRYSTSILGGNYGVVDFFIKKSFFQVLAFRLRPEQHPRGGGQQVGRRGGGRGLQRP